MPFVELNVQKEIINRISYVRTKLFWKMDAGARKIHCISYDSSIDNYAFLRNCHDQGYKQVIISSEIMIQLICEACLEKGHKITKIEFVKEEAELEEEIQVILQLMDRDSAYFCDFIDKLKFLAERSSIGIKRVYIRGLYAKDFIESYFLQSNGIIGINKESFSQISSNISCYIEKYLMNTRNDEKRFLWKTKI